VVGHGGAWGASAPSRDAAPLLRALHHEVSRDFRPQEFGRPMLLRSAETATGLVGEVLAEVDHPIANVRAWMADPMHWCEAMVTHINTKQCVVRKRDDQPTLELSIVRKFDQPIDQAIQLDFGYRLIASTDEFAEAQLASAQGPLGTSNYRILLQGVALSSHKSFLRFAYSYDSNALAKVATQAFLATFGRSKVGFTTIGTRPDGTPEFIPGTRGLIERNAMRYFLAIDAYLNTDAADPQRRHEARLRHWFAATERYPRQLHETDLQTFMQLKRADRVVVE
jgi:hypothetical protein